MAKRKKKAKTTGKKRISAAVPRYDDHLDPLQQKTNWTLSKMACSICNSIRSGEHVYQQDDVRICRDCALRLFKRNAKRASLDNWTSRDFIESLSPEADLARRFTVLFRYREAEERLAQTGPENLETIRRRLLDHLGHVDGHPLEREVRTVAHHACVAVGEGILDLLVSVRKPKAPWQFVANQVLTAGAIDPEHPKVKAMLHAAAKDASPSVRIYAARGVGLHDAHWARQLLETLERDANPLVREAVADIRAGHRERARKTPRPQPEPKKRNRPLSPIESAIDESYSDGFLKVVYDVYLTGFTDNSQWGDDKKSWIDKLRKTELVEALGAVFASKKRFGRLLDQMPEGVKTVLKALVWEGSPQTVSVFEKIDPPIFIPVQETRYGRQETVEKINPVYLVLPFGEIYDGRAGWRRAQDRYAFFMPGVLREQFKTYLTPPPEYHLAGEDAIDKTRFILSEEDRIFPQLEIISAHIHQGTLQFAKSGNKVLKNSMRQMVEACRLQEFYPDVARDLDYARGQLMVQFLSSERKAPLAEGTPEALKAAFQTFFEGSGYRSFSLADLLTHLKGRGYYGGSGYGSLSEIEKAVRGSLPALLGNLPEDRWVDLTTLFKHCRCRDIDLDIIHRSLAAQYVYFWSKSDGEGDGYIHRTPVDVERYDAAVAAPFLKGVLFFFAAFGLVEIAYDRPRNPTLKQEGKPYLSIWDGLRFVRITPLGRFIVGKSDHYEAETAPETAAVSLDENRLLVHLHGRDPIKEMALSRMAERVADTLYKVSFQSFLKGCNTEADIRERKALFHQHIKAEPAGIWKNFLDEVEGKVDPLVPVRSMAVFRLKENPELISLAARDPVLKKYILKAEDYHVLIPKKDLQKVRNRLEAFGYLIQDLR